MDSSDCAFNTAPHLSLKSGLAKAGRADGTQGGCIAHGTGGVENHSTKSPERRLHIRVETGELDPGDKPVPVFGVTGVGQGLRRFRVRTVSFLSFLSFLSLIRLGTLQSSPEDSPCQT